MPGHRPPIARRTAWHPIRLGWDGFLRGHGRSSPMQGHLRECGTEECRCDDREARPLTIKFIRPSLVDPLQPAAPELGCCVCVPNILVLSQLTRPIALTPGTPIDLPALNARLS